MYKILIDTTDRHNKLVSLLKIENSAEEILAKKIGDIDIVSSIKELLEKAEVNLEEVSKIQANPGPGSFTGIRIGITIANILNWVTGKKDISHMDLPEYGREPNIQKTTKTP